MEYEVRDTAAETADEAQTAERPGEFTIPHAERVITVMGVTGAIGQLFNLCPVPHDQMTQSSVDAYVEKLITMDEAQQPEEEEPEAEDSEADGTENDLSAKKKLN
jgi:hypothetical protein